MPIDMRNLIEQKQVAANVFACLYQRPGLFMLRLCRADSSIVNPTRSGFMLQNLDQRQRKVEVGGGEEVFFVLLMKERYSLRLHNQEVASYQASYGGAHTCIGPSKEEVARHERGFNAIVKFLKTNTPTHGSIPHPVILTEGSSDLLLLDHGDMGVPWDPTLFIPNNFEYYSPWAESGSSSSHGGPSTN